MNSTELLDRFRSDVRDNAGGQLWSDSEIYQNINDAQLVFCRLTGGIADSRSALTKIRYKVGQEYIDFDKRILKIRKVTRVEDGEDVELLNFEDLQSDRMRLDSTSGEVRAVITGMNRFAGRLYYIPDTAGELRLIVYRQPLDPITTKGQELEIDEEHHLHLLLWVKHLAYAKQDAETYNKQKSVEFADLFRAYCEQARREKERLEHKYRTVQYGGY